MRACVSAFLVLVPLRCRSRLDMQVLFYTGTAVTNFASVGQEERKEKNETVGPTELWPAWAAGGFLAARRKGTVVFQPLDLGGPKVTQSDLEGGTVWIYLVCVTTGSWMSSSGTPRRTYATGLRLRSDRLKVKMKEWAWHVQRKERETGKFLSDTSVTATYL